MTTSTIAIVQSAIAAGGHEAAEGVKHYHAHHPELPNLIGLILETTHMNIASGVGFILANYMHAIYSLAIVCALSLIVYLGTRHAKERPGPLQNAIEFIVETFYNFFTGILGPKYGPRFTPFLGTLFVFIIANNWAGLIPLSIAPTSRIFTTAALAITVFFYVQYIAMTELGLPKYLMHLAGDPQNVVMWMLVPLFFVLHIIGELAKPLSLALRLFGNILGEDILLGTFMIMGVDLVGGEWFGIPLHLPFLFLSLLLGSIQALVFTLLSTIYIMMVLPHDDHEHEGEHARERATADPNQAIEEQLPEHA